jgi:hypothetical protein
VVAAPVPSHDPRADLVHARILAPQFAEMVELAERRRLDRNGLGSPRAGQGAS